MGQSNIFLPFKWLANSALRPASLDTGTGTTLLTSVGGDKNLLNITAATVIKASPGRLAKIIIIAPGTTGGAFTFNDCITTGAAAAANEVWSVAFNGSGVVAGAVFALDFPFNVGITLSAVPTAGSPIIAVSYI